MMDNNKFKSGFVSIVGMPNVGKSTLLNMIAGQKIAIISDKPQTTRNKILAIYTNEDEQIIFTDTPGIHKPHNKLGEFMVKAANESMNDVDVILFCVDSTKPICKTEHDIAENIKKLRLPCILVLNKIDLVKKDTLLPLIAEYSNLNDFEAIVPISAKSGDGVEILLNNIRQYIPYGPKFYYDDMVTDQSEKQIVAELIREKALRLLNQEIPHGIAVEIVKMKEKGDKVCEISANIYCEKESHKRIIIGSKGSKLKAIGSQARIDCEKMLDKKVFLELWGKVKPDWRNSEQMMKEFGMNDL